MNIDWSNVPEWADRIARDPHGQFAAIGANGYSFYYNMKESCQHPFKDQWLPKHFTTISVRPKQWTGGGLPPIGTVCEWKDGAMKWEECRIVGHDGDCAVFAYKNTNYYARPAAHFRPIRTPEQIEADERQKEVIAIGDILIANRGNSTEYHQAELIYDAGYRKQVQP